MKKPVVGVIFGSRSTEHDVSVVTAIASVIRPLEASKQFTVVPIYIAKDGRWFSDKALKDISLYSSGAIDKWLQKHEPVDLAMAGADGRKRGGLRLVAKGFHLRETHLDVVFPALHGTYGEDGAAMGLFEMAGVPYVGCDVAASAVAMDKVLTKLVAQASGIDVSPFQHFTKHEYEADPDVWVTAINRKLKYPLFVKPAHLGSSIGISRVAEPKDLRNAIEVALHFDSKAIVEEAVSNLVEVTLPIIGNGTPRPTLLEQPMVHAEDFFDFDTKYMSGGAKGGKSGGAKGGASGAQGYSTIPADLPKELYAKAEATGLAVYRALGCSGLARVDMLIDTKTETVYCNEVNPLPGSLYQHNWNRAGVSNVALVTELVNLAFDRYAKRTALETTFATNFLKQF
jgi:D-alanine-D-alanine ligase